LTKTLEKAFQNTRSNCRGLADKMCRAYLQIARLMSCLTFIERRQIIQADRFCKVLLLLDGLDEAWTFAERKNVDLKKFLIDLVRGNLIVRKGVKLVLSSRI
jgi:hypothetical protein